MLNLDQIRQKHGPKQWTLEVPEWEGQVLARRMTAPDYLALTDASGPLTAAQTFDYMVRLVEFSLVNEDGTPLITEENRDLLTDSPILTARLGKELMRLNGMGGEKKS